MTPEAEREFDRQAGAGLWVALVAILLLVALAMAACAEWT